MRVKVWVKPNAKQEKVERIDEKEFKIWTRSPPVDGKANEGVIQLLSEHYGIPKSRIELISGHRGKIKLFEIR